MQLAAFARRSATGCYTILGDLAQSTGHWARDSWDEVINTLRKDAPVAMAELRHGNRVPRQAFELAVGLLPFAAPAVIAPDVIRDGPSDPTFVGVTEPTRAAAVMKATQDYASQGLSVGVVCPGCDPG